MPTPSCISSVANEAQLTGDYTVDTCRQYHHAVHQSGPCAGPDPRPGRRRYSWRARQAGGRPATGLSKFYVSPQVVVTIADTGGIGVDVTGLVSAPRHYTVPLHARLNDVLQQAVPALNADLSKVVITRGDTKTQGNHRLPLLPRHQSRDAGNPLLRNGDIISVGSREPLPIFVNVQGQVGKPGRFQVPANTTAYTALQAAGGPTVAANMTAIVIKHFGMTDTIPFNYARPVRTPPTRRNPVLLDGDTIIVPQRRSRPPIRLPGRASATRRNTRCRTVLRSLWLAAIGKAGGLSDRAQIKAVQIIRIDPKTQASQTIKLDATNPSVQGSYWSSPATTSPSARAARRAGLTRSRCSGS